MSYPVDTMVHPAGIEFPGETMRKNVLIIEDSANLRTLYLQEFEDEPFAIHLAESGPAALELIRSGGLKPDLVVLDVCLHGRRKEGFEILDTLWKEHRAPVILNTAYTLPENAALPDAVVAYIIKSSDLTSLRSAVRRALA
jgi:CheY-like chemotaxis protein